MALSRDASRNTTRNSANESGAPSRSTTNPDASPLQIVSKSRSYGGDGFSSYTDDGSDEKLEDDDLEAGKVTSEKHFEVRWEGRNDPKSPRNFHVMRKWASVIIVSVCSLCV